MNVSRIDLLPASRGDVAEHDDGLAAAVQVAVLMAAGYRVRAQLDPALVGAAGPQLDRSADRRRAPAHRASGSSTWSRISA